jgi:hypothetical protein
MNEKLKNASFSKRRMTVLICNYKLARFIDGGKKVFASKTLQLFCLRERK